MIFLPGSAKLVVCNQLQDFMPTYAYRCPRCAHAFERFHKMNDSAPQACPECGAAGERVITGGAGLVFKGSGFYITDYKRQPDTPKGGDGGAKTKDGDAPKGSSPSESKPTAKPDSGSSKSAGGDAS